MNLKQAKALRAGLREFAKLRHPERAAEYRVIEHIGSVIDKDGVRHEVPIARTCILSPTSPRGLYQRAKRGIAAGGLDFKSGGIHRARLRSKVLGFLGEPAAVPADTQGSPKGIAPPERERSDRVVGIGAGSQA